LLVEVLLVEVLRDEDDSVEVLGSDAVEVLRADWVEVGVELVTDDVL